MSTPDALMTNPEIMTVRRRINAAVLLGIIVLARPGCTSVSGPNALLEGSWGGEHLRLELADSIGQAEFDCAHGRIHLPALLMGDSFTATGTYTQEHGGPIWQGEEENAVPARYTGRITGDRLSLTVVLTTDSRTIGSFELRRGSQGRVFKCL